MADGELTTEAGLVVERSYGPGDLAPDHEARVGEPGAFPFTRGNHPGGYRDKLWTFRQYSGFGTAEWSNERYKLLLEMGGTGLSVAADLPTQIARAPRDARVGIKAAQRAADPSARPDLAAAAIASFAGTWVADAHWEMVEQAEARRRAARGGD